MSAAQSEASAAFESGLLAGVSAVGVPAVGVELNGTEPSQVPWYKSKGISSVDDLDTVAGQTALVYALAGDRGAYGSSRAPTRCCRRSPSPARRPELRPRTRVSFQSVHALPFLVALATAAVLSRAVLRRCAAAGR